MRYRLWGRLPRWLRRRLVRLISPSFTVGAACIVEQAESVLLVRLAYKEGWGMPGGLLDRGEEPAAAAVREVAEEVGLAIDIVGPPTVVAYATSRRLDIVFRCRPAAGVDPTSIHARSPEILDARWWPVAGLPRLTPETAAAWRASRLLR